MVASMACAFRLYGVVCSIAAEMERAESTSTAQPQLSWRLEGSGEEAASLSAAPGEAGGGVGVHSVCIRSARTAGESTFESSKWCVLERRGWERAIGR